MNKRDLISRLKSLTDYYRGVPEQKEENNKLLDMLRDDYQLAQNVYSKNEIDEINSLKNKIYRYNNQLPYKLERTSGFKKGAIVYHKDKYYVGVIDDTTKMRELFEDLNDTFEYRVRIVNKNENCITK
jgi:hypothetical protein